MCCLPRRTTSVTDTDATHLDPVTVKRKTAAEDVHAADALANHGIVRRTERGTTGGAKARGHEIKI